ncbi:MAG: DUF3440 domain-containing protein [Clostridia bacterium]|nr:DUF3440 domain-containing protein [Clostridia bacterium]MBQ2957825.1 DUF3440 domain-containing protein [Clostridia bacterium]
MPKIYEEQNVLDAAIERLRYVFHTFDSIYFSVSGGKDSSVMVQLAERVAAETGKTYDVLYIDLEAQYAHTIAHVEELKTLAHIGTFYHVALPMALRNAVSMLQPKWICWDEEAESLWVRPLPQDAITLHNCSWEWFHRGMEFEEFIVDFARWYHELHMGNIACGVGIRADESLNRFQTIAFHERKEEYDGHHWTTRLEEGIYNFYPIYDWRTEDIWGAVSQLDLMSNEIYELMYKNGLSIHQQRLCQPYGDDQRNGLDQFRALEPETWEKVLHRVNGVNFGNIYARTTALGNIKSFKPDHMDWEQYTVFLLESIGLYNRELMLHYYGKIRKFIRWFEKTEGITIADIPGEADRQLEQQRKAISWRRIARAIEKNDFYMKRLSFAQTKSDMAKLEKFMRTWSNFLTRDSDVTDKDLLRLIERRELDGDQETDAE